MTIEYKQHTVFHSDKKNNGPTAQMYLRGKKTEPYEILYDK